MTLIKYRYQLAWRVVLLAVLCCVGISSPYYAVVALAAEQEGGTVELPPALHAQYLPTLHTGKSNGVASCKPDAAGESDNVSNAIKVCSGQVVSGQVTMQATDDVYRIHLIPGDRLILALDGTGADADLYIYPPRTTDVDEINRDQWVATSNGLNSKESLEVTADRSGYWYIDVYAFKGTIQYSLSITVQ